MRRYLVVVLAAACGGNDVDPVDPEATLPAITMIEPDLVAVGVPRQPLRILGSGFDPEAVVLFDGELRTPTVMSDGELAIEIIDADTLFPAVHQLRVINPGTGRNASNVVRLDVVIPNGVPLVDALVPNSAIVGSGDLALEIRGSDFAAGATVTWGGEVLASTRVDGRTLALTVPTAKLAALGTVPVVVTNPMPGGGMSSPRNFVVRDVAQPAGVLARASLAGDGGELAAGSGQAFVSDDGRYIAFQTNADNVVPGDTNGRGDMFLRDTCLGESACTPSTVPLSARPDGTFGDTALFILAGSGDLRYVAYRGTADQVPGLPQNAIVIRDTCAGASGCTPSTYQASPGQADDSRGLDVSDDGRFVAFVTGASLVAGDTGGIDVYVHDNCRGAVGCTPSSVLVSATPAGAGGNNLSEKPSISADGRYVAFQSLASDLAPGDANGTFDIYVRDTCLGASGCTPSTIRVSVDGAGDGGNADALQPSLDRDGRFVAFGTRSRLVATDTDNAEDLYIRDTCLGAQGCTPATIHVTPTDTNPFTSGPRALSRGGRYLAYVADDPATFRDDAFVRDTCIGVPACTPSVQTIHTGGATPDGNASREITLSADGRHASLASRATNLVPNDTNDQTDVFVAATGF